MQSQIKISLRPNNQISLTKGRYRKKIIEINRPIQWDLDKVNPEKAEQAKEQLYNDRVIYQINQKERKANPRPPLDIIKKSQQGEKRPACKLNKPKNFTGKSGQKLRESGAAVDIACNGNTRFCHEVTLTLPANTREAFIALAAHSGYAINRLFEPIRKKYGDMCLWFFVWEYQRRGALHLHICIYHPDECEGLYIASQLIAQWHKILCDISLRADTCMFTRKNKKECVPFFNHQHHTAPIKKAVGAYFSKYAGKRESKQSWYCQKYPVSRFWGSCYAIKNIIKENSLSFSFDYQGNEKEAIEKFEAIIQNVIEKLSIVSASEYSFCIAAKGKARINHYSKNRKILSILPDKIFAEGTRYTFYLNQIELKKAMELIEKECSGF